MRKTGSVKMRVEPDQLSEIVRVLNSCGDQISQSGTSLTRVRPDDVALQALHRRVSHVAAMLHAEATELRHLADEVHRVLGHDRDLASLAARLFGPSAVTPTTYARSGNLDQWRAQVGRLMDAPMHGVERQASAMGGDEESKSWLDVFARSSSSAGGRTRRFMAPSLSRTRQSEPTSES